MSYMEWFSLGLLLVLLELFVPGVYLVWFGLSAFVTGALTIYHDFTVIEQSLVFGLISVVRPHRLVLLRPDHETQQGFRPV